MSSAQLAVVPNSREAQRDAFYAEMRRKGDAKNRLPEAFIDAAAQAIACLEMGVKHRSQLSGNYEERTLAHASYDAVVTKVRNSFSDAAFTIDDSLSDPNNSGQLLRITIDLAKTDLGHNQRAIAHNAINNKIGWMGYERTDFGSGDGTKIGVAYPAYVKNS